MVRHLNNIFQSDEQEIITYVSLCGISSENSFLNQSIHPPEVVFLNDAVVLIELITLLITAIEILQRRTLNETTMVDTLRFEKSRTMVYSSKSRETSFLYRIICKQVQTKWT